MRALITGINGFVGGHLAEYLLDTSRWELWGISRTASLALSHLRDHVQFISADLRDPQQTAQALAHIRPQVIFHLAGQPFVPESFRTPADTLNTNILAQLNIFLAMIEQRLDARMLVVSTNEVYGAIQPEDLPLNEETPFRPTSPYGVSKLTQDMLALQYYQSHTLDVVRVRPFTHIGPRQNERFVSAAFARQIARIEQDMQPPMLFVGNLSAKRDFTDVRDIVRAYALAVERGQAGAVYNIGSGRPVTIRALLDQLLATSHVDVTVETDPERMRPVDIPLMVCDPQRFHAQTGWEPCISFEQTLHDILNDWRERVRHTT